MQVLNTRCNTCTLILQLLPLDIPHFQEENLRATQYLPDIVKLQQFLFETFNRRLEKSKARTQTIREFLRELKNGEYR